MFCQKILNSIPAQRAAPSVTKKGIGGVTFIHLQPVTQGADGITTQGNARSFRLSKAFNKQICKGGSYAKVRFLAQRVLDSIWPASGG